MPFAARCKTWITSLGQIRLGALKSQLCTTPAAHNSQPGALTHLACRAAATPIRSRLGELPPMKGRNRTLRASVWPIRPHQQATTHNTSKGPSLIGGPGSAPWALIGALWIQVARNRSCWWKPIRFQVDTAARGTPRTGNTYDQLGIAGQCPMRLRGACLGSVMLSQRSQLPMGCPHSRQALQQVAFNSVIGVSPFRQALS